MKLVVIQINELEIKMVKFVI